MIHDELCRKTIDTNPNMMIPWWIMAAWAYQYGDDPIISDGLFDEMAIRMKRDWDKLRHRHKLLLDKKLLNSAIAMHPRKWPTMAVNAAMRLQRGPPEPAVDAKGQGLLL